MTWIARPTITDVIETSDGRTVLHATALLGGSVTYANSSLPVLYSNTEGELLSVDIAITVDGPVSLAVGDVLSVTGHFDNTVKELAA